MRRFSPHRPVRRLRRHDPRLRRHRPLRAGLRRRDGRRRRRHLRRQLRPDHVVAGTDRDRSRPSRKADVVIGGPPCQGFSPLNTRGVGLRTAGLWREYLRALRESEAAGLRDGERSRAAPLRRVRRVHGARPSELGYTVEGGSSTPPTTACRRRRRRAIVIGSATGSVRVARADPLRAGSESLPTGNRWRTFRDAVDGSAAEPRRASTGTSARNPRPRASTATGRSPTGGTASDAAARHAGSAISSALLAQQADRHDRRLRPALVGPARVHDPHRVLQAREGPLPPPERAPADHDPRSRPLHELPRRLRPPRGSADDLDRQADRKRRRSCAGSRAWRRPSPATSICTNRNSWRPSGSVSASSLRPSSPL